MYVYAYLPTPLTEVDAQGLVELFGQGLPAGLLAVPIELLEQVPAQVDGAPGVADLELLRRPLRAAG